MKLILFLVVIWLLSIILAPYFTQLQLEKDRYDCDTGNFKVCTNLGFMYAKGEGIAQDYPKAVELYKKACDAGAEEGCLNLGIIHHKGKEVPQDYIKALEFLKKACDGGNTDGCFNLGLMYYKRSRSTSRLY